MKHTDNITIDELLPDGDMGVQDESELWRKKREGQERSRQLVSDGLRKPEDNFLFPRSVVKNSKIRWRG